MQMVMCRCLIRHGPCPSSVKIGRKGGGMIRMEEPDMVLYAWLVVLFVVFGGSGFA